ncbi:phage integrase N-terminal domain-containing protein, partial [Acinetobacter baumannii]
CDRNKDGSHTTQANRRAMLSQMTEDLKSLGYKVKDMQPSDLKGRHINALVKKWKEDGKSAGTIKTRMAVVRWWSVQIGKADMVKDNSTYGR